MKSRPAIGMGLMGASAGSGCLDILSYRFLGEVFPSAMTGNLALLGRSLGEGQFGAAGRNACAFGFFFIGVLTGAVLLRGTPGKGRFLLTLLVQAVVLGVFAFAWERDAAGPLRLALIGGAALGMGLQSAVAYRIGVHAVSTTYFTGTTANIAFGLVSPSQRLPQAVGWPVLALISYLGGAALAGWDIVTPLLPPGPVGLQALPVLTTVVLASCIAAARLDPARRA